MSKTYITVLKKDWSGNVKYHSTHEDQAAMLRSFQAREDVLEVTVGQSSPDYMDLTVRTNRVLLPTEHYHFREAAYSGDAA